MFRAKLYLFLLGIVFAFLAVSLSIVTSHRDVVLDDTRKDMTTLPTRYEQVIELRFHQLQEIGHELSGSVLGAYLYTLREYRDQMRDMEKELFSADFAAIHEGEDIDEARAASVKANDGFLESFSNTLADKIVMTRPKYFGDKQPRAEFIAQTETMMINCMASALDTCYFKATYFPLAEEAVPEIEKARPSVHLDFAIVLDDRGIGRAHSRDPKWSGKQKFADKYPVAFAARTNPDRVYRDIVYFEDTEKYFLVAVVPLKNDAKLLGFLVVGSALDTALTDDATLMNADLSFFAGDKVISTTLPKGNRIEELKATGRAATGKSTQFDTSTLIAASATLGGNYSNNSVRAVFSRDIESLVGFVDSSVLWLIVTGALSFVISLIVLQIFITQFMKPLEEIETGIHRIISGDKEYYFPFDYREGIAKSLAETMNLMVAVLLGKPLPEEEDEAEFMEEALSFVDGSTGEFKKVDAPSHEKTTLFDMNPDEYYKQLYQEFIEAHETLGNDMSRMTRLKFVEKIANNETQLRLRTGKSQVRFNVLVQDKEVQLHPNFVD